MFYLIQSYWWVFLLALLIGFVTGWWAWAHNRLNVSAGLSGATGAMTGAVGAVGGLATGAAGSAMGAAKSVAGGVADAAHGAVDVASGAAGAVGGAVSGVAGAATGAVAAGVAGVAAIAKPKIAAAVGAPDDLLQIKGIGPKLNALCHSLGVTRFDQIAKWNTGDVAEVDQHLGTFRGRIERDGWIEQAGMLATGNIAAFEAKYGKLDSENKK
jgi:predicted flap endonuclease-1-like 5' DNA nuclease